MDWNELFSDIPRLTAANSLYKNVRHGRFKSFKAILDRGVDINSKNDFGENVLIAALRIEDDSKRHKIFKFLLKREADIHFKDRKRERSVLLWICVLERTNELRVFLRDAGGEIDLKDTDKDGYTALHYATKANCTNMVLELVNVCSRFHESVDILDNNGFTPYIMARRLGYRDIAAILQNEGNASPAQSDSARFRSCREWSSYGRWERRKEGRKRRMQQLVFNKINGDYKYGSKTNTNSIGGSNECVSQDYLPSLRTVRDDLHRRDEVDAHAKLRRCSIAAMSLLDMTSLDRGHLVRSFHQSEFDTSKSSEYKDVFGNLNTILDALSQQNSTSFRKTAIEPLRPIRIFQNVPDKPKVSSLAIIMGKHRNTGKSSRATRKAKNQSKTVRINCNNSITKPKPESTLPQIKLNNKYI